MVTSVNQVQRVEAADSPTIWINGNGSVTPPTTLITSVDNVTYTLTDNITGTTGMRPLMFRETTSFSMGQVIPCRTWFVIPASISATETM